MAPKALEEFHATQDHLLDATHDHILEATHDHFLEATTNRGKENRDRGRVRTENK